MTISVRISDAVLQGPSYGQNGAYRTTWHAF